MCSSDRRLHTSPVSRHTSIQSEPPNSHYHRPRQTWAVGPASVLNGEMERLSDTPRAGHQYTGIFADGHARQHNGDRIINHYINYVTVTDSVVNVTESSNIVSRQNTSPQTKLAHKRLEGTRRDTASMIVHRDDESSIGAISRTTALSSP